MDLIWIIYGLLLVSQQYMRLSYNSSLYLSK